MPTPRRTPKTPDGPRPPQASSPVAPPAGAPPPSGPLPPAQDWARPPDRTPRPRRSPKLIAIGVLCACLGGLGAAFAWTNLSQAESVIVVERAVARGDIIKAGDLGLADVTAGPGVKVVPADKLAGLVGQRALTDLAPGTLIDPSAIGNPGIPDHESVVGLRLPSGHAPVGKLPYGTKVMLIEVAKDDLGLVAAWTVHATVVTASTTAGDGSVLFDVSVADDQAVAAALLSARGELAVMRLGD